ncbi:MAG: hypothetical protein AAGD38_00670 [Acidobacteriota bacterium]
MRTTVLGTVLLIMVLGVLSGCGNETKERNDDLREWEQRLEHREQELNQRHQELEQRKQELDEREQELDERMDTISRLEDAFDFFEAMPRLPVMPASRPKRLLDNEFRWFDNGTSDTCVLFSEDAMETVDRIYLNELTPDIWPGAILAMDAGVPMKMVEPRLERSSGTVHYRGRGATSLEVTPYDRSAVEAFLATTAAHDGTAVNKEARFESWRSTSYRRVALGAGASIGGSPFPTVFKDRKRNDIEAFFEHVLVGNSIGLSAEAKLSVSRDEEFEISRFHQVMYTADFEAPGSSIAFFDAPDRAVFESEFATDQIPVYVSRVAYGRMLLLRTSRKTSETSRSLDLSHDVAFGPVDFEASGGGEWVDGTSESYTVVQSLGGARPLPDEITVRGIRDFLSAETAMSDAQPIYYELAYLADQTAVRPFRTGSILHADCRHQRLPELEAELSVSRLCLKKSQDTFGDATEEVFFQVHATRDGLFEGMMEVPRDRAVSVTADPSCQNAAQVEGVSMHLGFEQINGRCVSVSGEYFDRGDMLPFQLGDDSLGNSTEDICFHDGTLSTTGFVEKVRDNQLEIVFDVDLKL